MDECTEQYRKEYIPMTLTNPGHVEEIEQKRSLRLALC